jgi:hypothetical protein
MTGTASVLNQMEEAVRQIATAPKEVIDSAVDTIKQTTAASLGRADDPNVIDAFYRIAELMSLPPTGGVTFSAFKDLWPFERLYGEREDDLTRAEVQDCWAEGAKGNTRVNRAGFDKAWRAVNDLFEEDILDYLFEEDKPPSKTTTTMMNLRAVRGLGRGTPTSPRRRT